MKKIFSLIIATIVAVTLTSNSYANTNGGGDKEKCGGGNHCSTDNCVSKLNLSQEQKDKIKALRETFRTNTKVTLDEIRDLKSKAKELKANGDKAGLEQLRGQIESKGLVIKAQHEKLEADIKNVLTTEQQTQLADMMKNKGEGKRGECMKNKGCCKEKEAKMKACCKGKKTEDAATTTIEKNKDAEIK